MRATNLILISLIFLIIDQSQFVFNEEDRIRNETFEEKTNDRHKLDEDKILDAEEVQKELDLSRGNFVF